MLFKINYSNLLNIYIPACAVLFYIIEKKYPERKIDLKKDFHKDLVAFMALMFLGPYFVNPLSDFYRTYSFERLHFLYELHPVLKVVFATMLTDFCNYWVHYSMHRYNWYWKVHVFHHRIENLYWFSGLRASLMHYISFIIVRITVGLFLFKLTTAELFYYFAIGFTLNSYQHTNSRTTWKIAEWIFVTPRYHRLHHSAYGRKLKNIGTIFTFWDRMFGTYQDPGNVEGQYELGIKSRNNSFSLKEFIGY